MDLFRPCEGTNPVDWLSIISTDASGELGVTGLVGLECEEYKAGIDRVLVCDMCDGGHSLPEAVC